MPRAGCPVAEEQRACLHVCVTCRPDGGTGDASGAVPGRQLHDAAAALLDGDSQLGVQPVVCLANCERGCSAVLSAPGKWAYLVGHLGPEHADDLVTYARAYAASASGVVLRGGRPASMRDVILGRFPAAVADLAWASPATLKEAAE